MRILLVEDEEGVSKFIRKGLKEENYTVDLATDGELGLEMGCTGEFELIILDLMLPKLNGIQVCSELRKRGIQTPVLMLTARREIKDKVSGLDAGADDYLTKPFSFEEFLARIRALLRRKPEQFLELKIGELIINTQSHRVYINQSEIEFSPKEYAILVFLARNKDSVVSRTRIIDNVWGYDFDPNTNLVDAHIKTIRKKLSSHTKNKLIRTVRGSGYMVEEGVK